MQKAEQMNRMKELVTQLREASKAYYQEAREIMSNFEYDALYDELEELENKTGIVLSNSPTIQVGYEVLSQLPKEDHASPMLSLGKTKDVSELKSWLKDKEGILSWKLDGLTIVLTYRDGVLEKAVTRGNGVTGEVITNNAKVFQNVPLKIDFKGELVLRGEAVIKYSDFEKINAAIGVETERYKNPRNLCSGSVRQLNNKITAERNVNFFAFSLVNCIDENGAEVAFENSRKAQFSWLEELGFDVVEQKMVTAADIEDTVQWFSDKIEENDFPSDGLVLVYDDIEYGKSLGTTSKFPRDSIAFKWRDEVKESTLLEIEWSASRTGLINPVAIFEPVELEGTTVSRASVHNISIMENLQLGIGDKIEIYKANMIIPQIAQNLTKSSNLEIPKQCPVCHKETVIRQENDVKYLYCVNENCLAKKTKALTHFVSRDAMNIEGISEATLEKLVDRGFIHTLADIFRLDCYKDEIIEMEGMGLRISIEKAKNVTLPKFIYSLGILNIGLSTAKLICKEFHDDFDKMCHAAKEDLVAIDGIGEVIADTFIQYFTKKENMDLVEDLLSIVTIDTSQKEVEGGMIFEGMQFVITGSVEQFANRNEMKAWIEERGGKVTGSVTSKTTYLINNDTESTSSKNKKARELNIPILSEEELLHM